MAQRPTKEAIIEAIHELIEQNKAISCEALSLKLSISRFRLSRALGHHEIDLSHLRRERREEEFAKQLRHEVHRRGPSFNSRNYTPASLLRALSLPARPNAAQLLKRAGVPFKKHRKSFAERVHALGIDTSHHTPRKLAVLTGLPNYRNPARALQRAGIPYTRYKNTQSP